MLGEEDDKLLTISDVARLLNISERSVYRLVGAGKLHGFKPGGGAWRFRRSDIDAWVEDQVRCRAARSGTKAPE